MLSIVFVKNPRITAVKLASLGYTLLYVMSSSITFHSLPIEFRLGGEDGGR